MGATGTDTGGSIRGPSSVNGIVGLKPTHGLLSHDGIIPLALTLDMGGPMARSVSDAAALLTIMAGSDAQDAATREADARRADYMAALDAITKTVGVGARAAVYAPAARQLSE